MKQKTPAKITFYTGIIWSFLWGIAASISASSFMHAYTTEQVNTTPWALQGPLIAIWGLFGVPLGAIIAGIGILLYANKKQTALKYGIGTFITLILIAAIMMFVGHYKFLFGIGGTIILLAYFGILWHWAKEKNKRSANLKLTGYTFMLIATWFTCGAASRPYMKALEGTDPGSPLHIMIFFVLGWLFIFLGYRNR
ncbi:hypothetical protein ACFL3V_07205 [Nanoarchaeota archaeon]